MKTRGKKYLNGDTHQNIKDICHWTKVSYLSICMYVNLSVWRSINRPSNPLHEAYDWWYTLILGEFELGLDKR